MNRNASNAREKCAVCCQRVPRGVSKDTPSDYHSFCHLSACLCDFLKVEGLCVPVYRPALGGLEGRAGLLATGPTAGRAGGSFLALVVLRGPFRGTGSAPLAASKDDVPTTDRGRAAGIGLSSAAVSPPRPGLTARVGFAAGVGFAAAVGLADGDGLAAGRGLATVGGGGAGTSRTACSTGAGRNGCNAAERRAAAGEREVPASDAVRARMTGFDGAGALAAASCSAAEAGRPTVVADRRRGAGSACPSPRGLSGDGGGGAAVALALAGATSACACGLVAVLGLGGGTGEAAAACGLGRGTGAGADASVDTMLRGLGCGNIVCPTGFGGEASAVRGGAGAERKRVWGDRAV